MDNFNDSEGQRKGISSIFEGLPYRAPSLLDHEFFQMPSFNELLQMILEQFTLFGGISLLLVLYTIQALIPSG